MPDIEALNDPDILRDTPIGELAVRSAFGEAAVWKRRGDDVEERPRIIHYVEERGGVLDALYGKHFWVQGSIRRLYDALRGERKAGLRREHDQRRADFRRDFQRLLKKDPSRMREALFGGGR